MKRCIYDDIEEVSAPHPFGRHPRVRVRIFEGPPGEEVVVILTELPDNPGASVTNAVEFLAPQVLARHRERIRGRSVTWIEHYPRESRAGAEETFDLVEFAPQPGGSPVPRWSPLGRRGLDELLGT